MNRLVIGAAAIACLSATAGVAALAPTHFDYASASEESQQRFLERFGWGFRKIIGDGAGETAEVERVDADARWNSVDVDIRFTEPQVETFSSSEVEAVAQAIYVEYCKTDDEKRLLEQGVRMNLRMKRPSGGALSNVVLDDETCATFQSEESAR